MGEYILRICAELREGHIGVVQEQEPDGRKRSEHIKASSDALCGVSEMAW